MRAVVQRVRSASVSVSGEEVGRIGPGLMILLGVRKGDTEADARWLAEKIAGLRIFGDDEGKMNLSVSEIGGSALIVSQFTLYGDCRKGRRPGFDKAAPPDVAERLYSDFVNYIGDTGIPTSTGRFQAMMLVKIENDGPVTLIVETVEEREEETSNE